MSIETIYRCNLCNDQKQPAELVGFKWDKDGAPTAIPVAKAANHICFTCRASISQLPAPRE